MYLIRVAITLTLAGVLAGLLHADDRGCPPTWFPLIGPLDSGVETLFGADSVDALCVIDQVGLPTLVAGGEFEFAGGQQARNIAMWDGSAWSPMGNGFSDQCLALVVADLGSGPELFAGGRFASDGIYSPGDSQFFGRIAKWAGNDWVPLIGSSGTGTNGPVNDLAHLEDGNSSLLVVGGAFSSAGGSPANHIATWDGQEWSALGFGTNDSVHTVCVFDDGSGPAIYAGGVFTVAGGVPVNYVAKWDGVNWSPLAGPDGFGLNGPCSDLLVYNDGSGPALYAAGQFSAAGGVETRGGIAKWDGVTWQPLGEQLAAFSAAEVLGTFNDGDGQKLLVAGGFTGVGPDGDINSPAKWDGAAWSSLDPAETIIARAMVVYENGPDSGLVVGASSIGTIGPFEMNDVTIFRSECFAYPPSILTQPASIMLTPSGANGELSVTASGQELTYQWLRDGKPVQDGDGVVGAQTALLSLPPSASVEGVYWCEVTNAAGAIATSRTAIVGVRGSCEGDINGDGAVDLADLNILLSRFATVCP